MTSSDDARSADDASPYRVPGPDVEAEPLSTDPSVHAEPWMRKLGFQSDAGDVYGPTVSIPTGADPESSVWDEPGLSPILSGDIPDDAVTWWRHYSRQVQGTSAGSSWFITIVLALVAGPCAIVGTFISGRYADTQLVLVSIIGPTVEEIMKIAIPIWIVEKKPWLFRSAMQILLCSFVSGLAFAAVENVIYLNIYIPDASAGMIRWRWTVCVLLHSGCSLIAGIGVVRVWTRFQMATRPPALSDGAPFIVAAIVIHGIYNLFAMLLAAVEFQF